MIEKKRSVGVLVILLLAFPLVCFGQPELSFVYFDKGVDYGTKGEFVKAKIQFEKCLELEPYEVSNKFMLQLVKDAIDKKIKKETAIDMFSGIGVCGVGGYHDAVRLFSKAIANDPNYASAYAWRGAARLQCFKEEQQQAIPDFNKAIELDPNNAFAFAGRAQAYDMKCFHQKDQCELAISDYKKAIEIEPEYPGLYKDIADVYARVGRKEEAIEAYRTFIKYASDKSRYAYDIKEVEHKITELQETSSSPAPK